MRPIGHAREPHTPHPYDPEAGLLPKATRPLQPGDETGPRSKPGGFAYSPADSITPATIETSMCPFWSIAPW